MNEHVSLDEFRFLASDAERIGRDTPPPRVERIWAEVSEGRRISGLAFTPERPPRIAVLHGAGLNAHSYDPMLLALDVPAISLDLPGHGRSDWRADSDYRPQTLAPDVASALQKYTGHPLTLVGHSLGGLIASLVAAKVPELVRRLVVIDITPGLAPSRDTGTVTDFIQGKRSVANIDEIVDRAIEFGIGSDRRSLTRGVSLNTRLRPDGRLEWTHHLAHLDGLPTQGDDPHPYASVWQVLESLQIPVTLIRAETGIVTDGMFDEWQDRLPSSEVISLAGPHNLHEAEPTELADVLRARL